MEDHNKLFVGENSIGLLVEDALKDSGKKALERHAANCRPIVISVKGVIYNKYIDGRLIERALDPIHKLK
ncbi:MAG: hypothetical protein ACTHJT_04065 [Cytophaga sp.]|uniref:hypothetical protein n=1 Tax=Cytophaga sp. TaxID=29535 RepID=UPI003F7D683F